MCPTHSRAHDRSKAAGPPSPSAELCAPPLLDPVSQSCPTHASCFPLFLFSTYSSFSISFLILFGPLILSFPVLIDFSTPFFPLLVSSLCSFSLPLPLSSLFTEGSPPIPYLVFLGPRLLLILRPISLLSQTSSCKVSGCLADIQKVIEWRCLIYKAQRVGL